MDDAIEQARQELYDKLDQASKALQKFNKHRGPMGLLPDEVRTSTEYQRLKRNFDATHQQVRKFNMKYKPKRKPRFDKNGKPVRGNTFAARILDN